MSKIEELQVEYDMLQGNINRMFITEDEIEFAAMYKFAMKRLEHLAGELHTEKFEKQED